MKRSLFVIALITVIVSASWLPLTYGKPLYVQDLPSSFKDYCTTCHISSSGMGGLNRFGADFDRNGHSIERIAKLDSDRDGYTNGQELSAGTFPGDPDSYQGSRTSGIGIDIIAFVSTALVAAIALFWLRRSRL